jgi:DNA (cytosine-5)-methyltransferase 1
LDFGFEAAGFSTAVALELDPASCRVLRLNRSWPVIEDDIHVVSTQDILARGGLEAGQADVLIGGPPCQPFSKSGYWVRGDALRLNDPRATTLEAYLRVLEEALPRAFLLENVSGLAYAGKDEGLSQILRGIEMINRRQGTRYRPHVAVLNAAAYGVPQQRERVFIIGSREGAAFAFPRTMYADASDAEAINNGAEPYFTAWDAIGDLPALSNDAALRMTGKWAELLPSIPEGQNYLWHSPRGGGLPLFGWRTRYWSFLLKLAKDRPSWTIQAQPGSATGPFHWANRKLSEQELCRIQTFPSDVRFESSRGEVQRMLGNAVPSLLAEILAVEIRRQLLKRPRAETRYKLLPTRRADRPGAERIASVPAKFRALSGDHAPHPGEGLGRRAVLRSRVEDAVQ